MVQTGSSNSLRTHRLYHKEVDEITGKKMVSFRFDPELIEKLRILAKKDGPGYQTLVRQVLSRYVEALISIVPT